jgi:hypothetical protein
VQPVDLLIEVPVNRIDPQLDLVRARRCVPATPREYKFTAGSNPISWDESTRNEDLIRAGGASTGGLAWIGAVRSRTSGAPSSVTSEYRRQRSAARSREV